MISWLELLVLLLKVICNGYFITVSNLSVTLVIENRDKCMKSILGNLIKLSFFVVEPSDVVDEVWLPFCGFLLGDLLRLPNLKSPLFLVANTGCESSTLEDSGLEMFFEHLGHFHAFSPVKISSFV